MEAIMGSVTGAKNRTNMSAFSKVLKKAANGLADALPQIGSVKIDNSTNPASALRMAQRKSASAGPGKAFKIPK